MVIRHAWASPDANPPVWTVTTPFSQSGYDFTDGDFVTDVLSYSDYYVYAVAIATPGGTEANLHFARSTNAGDSWEANYALTFETGTTEAYYLRPHIAFGGGRVHLAFNYGDNCLGATCIKNSARTMYGSNFLGSGLSDWSGQYFHTTTSDPVDTSMESIVADPSGSDVYILYLRDSFAGNPLIRRSGDGGVTWSTADDISFAPDLLARRLFYDNSGTHLYATGVVDNTTGGCTEPPFVMDAVGNPKVFGAAQCFSAGYPLRGSLAPALVADPSAVGEFGLAWSVSAYVCGSGTPSPISFDATWFTNPGYPNQEPGFPMVLDHTPATPPLIAQLDADPYDEIAYSDTDGYVHLLAHNGVEVGGWPKYAGVIPDAGQVAAGDLNGDGDSALVVGNNAGEVWAWSSTTGAVLPGFPVDMATNAPTYVTVGPVLAPWPRSIVACSEDRVLVLNYRGEIQSEMKLNHMAIFPASIGDVDADGQPEIVVGAGNWLYVFNPELQNEEWSQSVTTYQVAGPPTLADMDFNGEREILVPTVNGFVHAYESDGTNAWSYDAGGFDAVSRIAAGDIIGNSTVEIVFSHGGEVHQVVNGGVSQGVYPRSSSDGLGGYLSDPILESVVNTASAAITNSSLQQGWAWTNVGYDIAGWPKALDEPTHLGSAAGDIDKDGSNEIVVLSDGLLSIWDVNTPPQATAKRKWPMVGGDPGRTNCHMCEDAIVTAVDETRGPTQLAFAAPYPNPTGGETAFAFALPQRAGVQVDLYDVRGRKVRQVLRSSLGPGEHVVHFDGRDDEGRPLANGQYFARLQVRGGGMDQTLTRKLTLVR
jgi:hypothetical protein